MAHTYIVSQSLTEILDKACEGDKTIVLYSESLIFINFSKILL